MLFTDNDGAPFFAPGVADGAAGDIATSAIFSANEPLTRATLLLGFAGLGRAGCQILKTMRRRHKAPSGNSCVHMAASLRPRLGIHEEEAKAENNRPAQEGANVPLPRLASPNIHDVSNLDHRILPECAFNGGSEVFFIPLDLVHQKTYRRSGRMARRERLAGRRVSFEVARPRQEASALICLCWAD
jgi:hypothetical protein